MCTQETDVLHLGVQSPAVVAEALCHLSAKPRPAISLCSSRPDPDLSQTAESGPAFVHGLYTHHAADIALHWFAYM